MIAAGEPLGPFTHHHHTLRCGLCGQCWFDDVVRGSFGQLVHARRDTQLCGQPVYTTVAVYGPRGPETSCACTKAPVDSCPIQVHLMPD